MNEDLRSADIRALGKVIAETQDAELHVERVAERAIESFERAMLDAPRAPMESHGRISGLRPKRDFLSVAKRHPRVILGLLAATLALALALVFVVRRVAAPVAWRDGGSKVGVGEFVRADGGQSLVRFSDGTTVTLSPNSRGRLIALDDDGGEVAIEDGRATVSVPPHHGRSWTIDAGPYRVLVTGTRFDVAWDEGARRFDLRMIEGRVEVRGPNANSLTVIAGEHLSLEPTVAVARPLSASGPVPIGAQKPDLPHDLPDPVGPPDGSAGSAIAPTAAPPTLSESATAPVAAAPDGRHAGKPLGRGWRALARESRFDDAVKAAEAVGFDAVCRSANASDLLMLGDVARLAERADRAHTAYEAVRSRHAGTPEAARAAFALGVMAFPSDSALPLLQEYLSQAPSGPLAPEALGRILEIRHRSGDSAGAREAAQRYLASYPNGAHAKLARSILTLR